MVRYVLTSFKSSGYVWLFYLVYAEVKKKNYQIYPIKYDGIKRHRC